MTDLKSLLDDAAGQEPALTDADLTGDLDRGRRAVRRRRITGIGAGAAATAAVIGVGWALLPGLSAANTQPQVATTTTPTPQPTTDHPPGRPTGPLPPKPAVPVELVARTTQFPGRLTCDLVPKGWTTKLLLRGDDEQVELSDPNLSNPEQYREYTYQIRLRWATMRDEGHGLIPDKYSEPWSELPHVMAGTKEAVSTGKSAYDGRTEVFVRQEKTGPRVIVVTDGAVNLGWDEKTLLKFAGSCSHK
ncbi:hypothetical protein E1263_04035 [Kribbella antibiotica]|uniref:Uncharacterized protein n=1 Tax=Kribbella antibiotica TaxID=190195 RepID=A0A4R4ZVT3_9ACTN|nr:hypothetical protein [Kribbella antibiotica]TDD62334.1 hypothetical protein E1263_04035 [Kribbella antibiotica]